MPALVLIALAAAYGAAAGLLVPRAAYRLAVPYGGPWRAECPGGHALPGWVGLARCGECAEHRGGTGGGGGAYGPSAMVSATVTAVVCALLATAVGGRPELGVWLLAAPFAVLLAVVDGAVHRLPDVVTLPLSAACVVLLGLAALLPGAGGSWTGALLGGAALGGFYSVLFLVNPRGMGLGDVKLAFPLGVALGWYGWGALLVGSFVGLVLGAVYGMSLVVMGRAGRKDAIPFGPFMSAGALAGLLLGGAVG
ncbi:prepilin peptidase [Streptomyces sp. TRM43335]|uniref:Prepilin peptidase n=1 Tax=Streptomyces taklimakanensis TaxID=2569853 RepID=A0A6G2BET8_9ACTN|nr:A24 family peptidase [Streptomyces taklimakanensis]MTE20791.1 prepilin peptidase [Streptomyces taklimakanensis]